MTHFPLKAIAAVAAIGLMAFASTASATVLTSPTGTQKTSGDLAFSAESTITVKQGFANATCTESTIAGTPTNFGSSTTTVGGPISTLTFRGCNLTVVVIKKGGFEIHSISGTENGTFKYGNFEVTFAGLGTSCVYGGGLVGTDFGSLTGGKPATLDVSAELTKVSGGFACADPAHMEGSYKVTTPGELWVS